MPTMPLSPLPVIPAFGDGIKFEAPKIQLPEPFDPSAGPDRFDEFINRVLSNEGGYVNNPRDPGGETQWGISRRSYPNVDIKTLTRIQAIEIYRRDYWNRINGPALKPAISFQVLDFAVNAGVETAIRKYQTALGVADDGFFGPLSQKSATEMSETDQVMNFAAVKIDFYKRLSTWPVFGAGWMSRVAADLRYAAQDS